MRRILLVLAVAALMAAMMVASAMPAFAVGNGLGIARAHACSHPIVNANAHVCID